MLLVIVLITPLLLSLTYLITKCIAISPSLPGPFLARFTDLWRAYQQYNGQLRSKLTTLHAKHGLVVRYGISSVSVSDPKAIDILYGSRAGFVIADSYQTLVGISNGKEVPSLVSTRDETRHGQLRRSVASAFTVRGSEGYESFVDSTIPDLLDAVRRSKGGKFDLPGLLMLYSMDSASRMAFSESLGCLKSGEDVGGSIALIRQTYYDAQWYKNATGKTEYNISLNALNKSMSLPQVFEVQNAYGVLRADKIGKEFGIHYIVKTTGDEYQRLDDKQLWEIASVHMPKLEPVVTRMLAERED